MDFYIYPLLVLAGFAAGFINTLAGAGSVITLAVLNLAGLPLPVANGTNRVAILCQTALAIGRFKKQGKLSVRPHLGIILPAILGGILGALIAGQVSSLVLRRSIGICMALTLVPLFLKPSRWLEGNAEREAKGSGPVQMISFFLIGIYGGYVQLGVGVFLLTALVLVAGLDLVRGNAVKLLIAFCYTVPALAIFVMNDLVRWDLGLTLAVGNMLGAWVATHEAANRGAPFIRWLLIVVVIVSSIRYLFF
jgi:uncharacterized membrane protein YfcA